MGNDGTGKTTIARALEVKFKESGFNVEYYLSFDHILLDFVLKLLPKAKVTKTRRDFSAKDGKKPFIFKIWPFLVFLDCLIVSIKVKLLNRSKIVIFDRYFYDFLISYEYLGYSNKVVRKLFLSLPKPRVGFILDVSPEVAYERKRETHNIDVSYYKIQRERYLELADDLGIKVINTEKPLEESLKQVITEIQTRFAIQRCRV